MDNYNQMMNNDYNNMVYQNADHQIPVEQEQQQQLPATDESLLLPEHAKVNEYEQQQAMAVEQQGYEQQSHLQPQDALLIQNHQAQLQQSSVIEPPAETYSGVEEQMEQETAPSTEETENAVTEEQAAEPVTEENAEVKEEGDAEAQDENAETAIKEEEGESQEPEEGTSEPPKPKEPKIDPEQCRACTSREALQSIFEFKGQEMIANLVKIICPQLKINERDALPHKICLACVEKVYAAYEFKQVAEATDKDFRAQLKRHQNKRRTASDYILLDAKVALLSSSEDDEDAMMQDDDDFQVSKSEVSESESEDSVDSDFKPKKKYYKKKAPPAKKKKVTPAKAPKKKVGRPPSSDKQKGYKSNVVYIEATENDSDEPVRKKKKATGVAAERSSGGLPCPQCDRVLANSHGLREHLKSHSTEKFTCKLCNKQFKVKLSLDAHMARHREEKERSDSVSKAKVKLVKVPSPVVKKVMTPMSSSKGHVSVKVKKEGEPTTGKDLFKSCAPLTSTYWSDSYSD